MKWFTNACILITPFSIWHFSDSCIAGSASRCLKIHETPQSNLEPDKKLNWWLQAACFCNRISLLWLSKIAGEHQWVYQMCNHHCRFLYLSLSDSRLNIKIFSIVEKYYDVNRKTMADPDLVTGKKLSETRQVIS